MQPGRRKDEKVLVPGLADRIGHVGAGENDAPQAVRMETDAVDLQTGFHDIPVGTEDPVAGLTQDRRHQ